MRKLIQSILLSVCCVIPAVAQQTALLPKGEEIIKTMESVNEWFVNRHPDPTVRSFGKGKYRPSSLWTRGVYYEGLMALYEIDPRPDYYEYTYRWCEFHDWTPRNGISTRDADDYCCSQTYIDMYRIDPKPEKLVHVIENCDMIVNQTELKDWWWIDAIQMGMPVFAKLGKTTGNPKYWEKAHSLYIYTRNEYDGGLWNEKDGLWWRDHDFNPPYVTPQGRQCYWSRGNGWVVAALCRVMDEIPESHPYYSQYKQDLLAMLESLKGRVREDGTWNCSLDDPDDFGGMEVTGTSLFVYGMAWALRHGYVTADDYLPVIAKAWNAMCSKAVHPEDGMLGFQQGTGKEPKESQPTLYDKIPDFDDFGIGCFLLCGSEVYKLTQMSAQWPVARREAKPGTRWWWMGSAVDSVNLTRNLETYANAGIGSVEITPIYGVNGNERNEIEFLSDRWMNMLSHTISEGKRLGIDVDMNTGTGWPFGGPSVNIDDAASKLEYTATAIGDSVRYDISCGHTRQAVKRAAPGGEGLVLDHLNKDAVARYLNRFKEAFSRTCSPLPHSFFNDSYEVYGADWTPSMLDEFEKRRGYRLQDHLTEFLQDSAANHRYVIQDYRETMSDLLLSNFTNQWAEWAHSMGSTVRNQGHGSPANLLDVYAAVDIPEIEGFGLTDFGISGLRTDSMWKKNDADLTMLKYASSAAHICGKPYTSSETFTWLTEHFRTSLSQCKPDFDLMQIGGVNHCYFHGTTYSPAIDESNPWPGHLFYASMEMSPVNTIWKDAPAFFSYITRVQSFMQYGKPDNDLLMYMPVYDAWYENDGRLLMFAIHGMEKKSPRFVDAVNEIYNAGYDMDYVSDRMIEDTRIGDDGTLLTSGGAHYKALVLPGVHFMQPETMTHILSLAKMGATIIIVGQRPDNVPGLYNRETRLNDLRGLVEGLDSCPNVIFADTYAVALDSISGIKAERMKSQYGLKCIRRSNASGHHYFISSLQSKGVDADVELAVAAKSAVLFDPMTGRRGIARINNDGSAASVRLQLASGESCILQTFAHLTDNDLRVLDPSLTTWNYTEEIDGHKITLDNIKWTMDATSLEGAENKDLRKYQTLGTQAWTETPALANTKGSVTYSTTVKFTRKQLQSIGASDWVLDLGDVRESAHVWINGHDAGTVFAVPFRLNIGQYLKAGKNQIRIEVTGLAANYIAQMDRNGKVWRRFKNANIAVLPGYDKNPAYKDYKNWGTIPCGLNSSVSLIPVRNN